jgi:hypothetical protein
MSAKMPARTLALLLLAATPAAAQLTYPEPEQYSFRLQARLWGPTMSSEVQFSGRQEGTVIDVTRDLAVQDQSTFEVRASVQLGLGHKIRLGYTNLRYSGEKVLTREIRFGDTTYPRGTELHSSLKGAYFSGDYELDFFKGTSGYLGALFGAKLFDIDAVLVAPSRGDRDIESVRVPVPVVGVVGQGYYGRFSAGGELSGFSIGPTANFIEFYVHSHFEISSQLGIEAGYRIFTVHGEHNNDKLDLTLGGLYFGAEVNF